MSTLNVDKVDPNTGTTLELGTSGDTVSLPSGATLDISASTLTPPATMPASSGINFTALNATNLGSGTLPDARFPATLPAASGVNLTSLDAANLGSNIVPTARLGSGTASSSTVLYGDQTYKAEPGGGKILQITQTGYTTQHNNSTTGSNTATGATGTITPSATSSDILVLVCDLLSSNIASGSGPMGGVSLWGDIGGGGYNLINDESGFGETYSQGITLIGETMEIRLSVQKSWNRIWSPSTTSACTVQVYSQPTYGSVSTQYGTVPTNVVLLEIDGS